MYYWGSTWQQGSSHYDKDLPAELLMHAVSLKMGTSRPLTPCRGKNTSPKTTPTTITTRKPMLTMSPLWSQDLEQADSCRRQ